MSSQEQPPYERYRNAFQHSAVSMWIQDIGGLRGLIRTWQGAGIGDIRAYLTDNTGELRAASHAIQVVDVNEATLEMYGVSDRGRVLGPLDRTLNLDDPAVRENIISDIVAIAEGQRTLEKRSTSVSRTGQRRDILITNHIPPEDSGSQEMLVTVINITEQRQHQRAREKDRTLYHTLINNLPAAVYLKDTERRFIFANEVTAEMMGAAKASDLIGRRDEDYYPAEIAEPFIERDREVLQEGKWVVAERETRNRGGTVRWVRTAKVPVRDDLNQIVGLVGVSTDLTELRQTQTALTRSENRYRSIHARAPVGIIHTDPSGRLIDVNPEFARIMGYDAPGELIEAVGSEGIGALCADTEELHRLFAAPLQSPDWQPHTWHFRRRDGQVGVGRLVLRAYSAEDDPADAGIEAYLEDITEPEQVRARLAHERRLLNALMDSVPERIFFKDRSGRFTLVNRAQAEAFGTSDAELLIGKSDEELFPAAYARSAREDEELILETGLPLIDKEERLERPGERDTWLLTTKMPLRDESDRLIGTFGISRDVTRQRELQARLIRVERLESLGQLAAGIAHQFNNINSAVLARLEVALRTEGLPESVAGHLKKILESVLRSREITDRLDILTQAARETLEPVELNEVIQVVLDQLGDRVEAAGIAIDLEFGELPPIPAGRRVVAFIVRSILTNAVDALLDHPAPRITVVTRSGSGAVGMEIGDNGPGVPEQDLPKLFTPFFTTKGEWAANQSPLSSVRGIGLSLAVTRSLVSELGGTVEVHSTEGQGTSITLWFPTGR